MSRLTLIACLALAACGGNSEAPTVDLPVVVDGTGLEAATNDLGYTVTLTAMRTAMRDIEFTIEGETHDSPEIVPFSAGAGSGELAHPGHLAGGEVTGELPGEFLIDWTDDGASIGTGTLIVGAYEGANFHFRRAVVDDGLEADDPLVGHTIAMAGSAVATGDPIEFTAVIDIDDDIPMIGAPFRLDVAEDTAVTLALATLTIDPIELDTMFDGVDFGALEAGGDGVVAIEPGSDAHNILKRNVQIHDQYLVSSR